ncbi:hypothetical protein JL720_9325 [Aureococcus anophagefferens]|nr:hypothetical protein JL720_9325 [Aureococcus anophagefferens]
MDAARTTGPTYTRELLSKHETIAIYRGVELGNEHLLRVFPPRERKQWARFDIEAYVSFEKPGKYGDEKQDAFRILRVRLSWLHNYVTKTETVDGRETKHSYPERPVTELVPADTPRR